MKKEDRFACKGKQWLKALSALALITGMTAQSAWAMGIITPGEEVNSVFQNPPQDANAQQSNLAEMPNAPVEQPLENNASLLGSQNNSKKSFFANDELMEAMSELLQNRSKIDDVFAKLKNGIDFIEFSKLTKPDRAFLEQIRAKPEGNPSKKYLKKKYKEALENADKGLDLTNYYNEELIDEAFLAFFDSLVELFSDEERAQIGLVINCNVNRENWKIRSERTQDLTDTVVIYVLKQFPGVKRIATCNCRKMLTNALMAELNQDGKYVDLEVFSVVNYVGRTHTDSWLKDNNACMEQFVKKSLKLKQFELSGPDHVINGGLIDALVKNCKDLELLYLGYYNNSYLTTLKAEDIKKLANCENLKKIWIYGCPNFTWEALDVLLGMPTLTLIRCNNSQVSSSSEKIIGTNKTVIETNKAKVESKLANRTGIEVELDGDHKIIK